VPPGETCANRLAEPSSPSGAKLQTDPLFRVCRLAKHALLPGATQYRDPLPGPIAWRASAGRQA